MILRQQLAIEILDQFSNTNRGWQIREADRGTGTYAIGNCSEKRALDYTVAQEVAQMRTYIRLPTKQFTTTEKINTMGT